MVNVMLINGLNQNSEDKMSKKKDDVYSMIMGETVTYGTVGLISGPLGATNVFKIGSSLGGIPSLMGVSKKVLDSFKGW
jgi:hypothetical protein